MLRSGRGLRPLRSCWLISQVAKPYAIVSGRKFAYSLTFAKALSLRSLEYLLSSSSGTLPLTAATIRSCTRFSEESHRRLTFGMPSISASFLISSLSFSSLGSISLIGGLIYLLFFSAFSLNANRAIALIRVVCSGVSQDALRQRHRAQTHKR